MGVNQIAAVGGSFIGLIAGGLLSIVDWRWSFGSRFPLASSGTVWSYKSLRDNGVRTPARIDGGATDLRRRITALLVGIV